MDTKEICGMKELDKEYPDFAYFWQLQIKYARRSCQVYLCELLWGQDAPHDANHQSTP